MIGSFVFAVPECVAKEGSQIHFFVVCFRTPGVHRNGERQRKRKKDYSCFVRSYLPDVIAEGRCAEGKNGVQNLVPL
jgi:hypothetical protein